MKAANRDLLVLSKNMFPDPTELEHEVQRLNEMLFTVESLQQFCISNEIIDVNQYKVIRKRHVIEQIIRENKLKPFQFLFNKN
ncbi:MAG: hypothetical protein JWQ96_803 [Segetibacter sp.]|nr:hypothetical protein [Segetibacter sp.]